MAGIGKRSRWRSKHNRLTGRPKEAEVKALRRWSDLTEEERSRQTLFCLVPRCHQVISHHQFFCQDHMCKLPAWARRNVEQHVDGECWRGKAWKDTEMAKVVTEALHKL